MSDWLLVDQDLISRFADTTGDTQFIHTDPDRAAATMFGGTIAHGFLLTALLPRLYESARSGEETSYRVAVNYGFNRLRFISPVRSGARIRGHFVVAEFEQKRAGQFQQVLDVTIEIEGEATPAMAASWINLFME